jgi:aminopeptidase N
LAIWCRKRTRELIDNDNDYIVAHEMMHHWFGDLVTCEDWSNLTLNEGFANYAEYLWFEHKYGKDRAEYHRMKEMNGYYSQVFGSGGAHPLVHYFYDDKGANV